MFARKSALVGALALGTLGSAVFAAAMDPDVRARQEAMGLVGSNVKKVAAMVKGEVDFDAAAAQAAFATIAEKAETVPALFETRSNSDPEAEAKDAIWDNWEDFTTKAADLQAAAEVGTLVDSPEALGASMETLGGACKACHSVYKD
jgi:cytochrome c556